jgi:predicted ATP-dependent endonuclease of OLD family
VLVSTHSTNFVSQNADDIPAIIRLCKDERATDIGQIAADQLAEIFSNNQKINCIPEMKSSLEKDDIESDMEAVKYFLWLNPERCGMFFAGRVLLVEGPTEWALINLLIDTGRVELPQGGVFVLDCMGKYNIHRFMNLLNPLNIAHAVLFDNDNGSGEHAALKQLIMDSRNEHTRTVRWFQQDLEQYLGIPGAGQRHRKPQHALMTYRDGTMQAPKVEELVALVNKLLSDRDVYEAVT